MRKDPDIRAQALADQLREIDLRYIGDGNRSLGWKHRAWQLVSNGIFLFSLNHLGLDLLWAFLVLVATNLAVEPLVRFYMARKGERERARVIGLYEEIDRRSAESDSMTE